METAFHDEPLVFLGAANSSATVPIQRLACTSFLRHPGLSQASKPLHVACIVVPVLRRDRRPSRIRLHFMIV